jgi:hypothetical protein
MVNGRVHGQDAGDVYLREDNSGDISKYKGTGGGQ